MPSPEDMARWAILVRAQGQLSFAGREKPNNAAQAEGGFVVPGCAARFPWDRWPLPSRAEQDEIVRRIESLFALADSIDARYQVGRTQVERLTPALLAKAFCGELVRQDPNDEPASELLARLRAPASTGAAPTHRKSKIKGETVE